MLDAPASMPEPLCSSLALFMAGVRAYNADNALALDYHAFIAYFFYAGSDFHFKITSLFAFTFPCKRYDLL